MSERPILMSAPMVRAILDGKKTQTRRNVKGTALDWLDRVGFTPEFIAAPENSLCHYGQPGDRLWVRETFQRFTDDSAILYKADPADLEAMNDLKRDECLEARWRPAIHMPRWASRITLEITGVRVERLQGISEADAQAEGAPPLDPNWPIPADGRGTHASGYRSLWEQINGAGSWAANPWVWVIEFRRANHD